jgi:hypothetical protein
VRDPGSGAGDRRRSSEEVTMSKRARKRKARKNGSANHGKRPNS